jgi:hypothetical protein
LPAHSKKATQNTIIFNLSSFLLTMPALLSICSSLQQHQHQHQHRYRLFSLCCSSLRAASAWAVGYGALIATGRCCRHYSSSWWRTQILMLQVSSGMMLAENNMLYLSPATGVEHANQGGHNFLGGGSDRFLR